MGVTTLLFSANLKFTKFAAFSNVRMFALQVEPMKACNIAMQGPNAAKATSWLKVVLLTF